MDIDKVKTTVSGGTARVTSILMVIMIAMAVFTGSFAGFAAADHDPTKTIDSDITVNSTTGSYTSDNIDVSGIDNVTITTNVTTLNSSEVPIEVIDDKTAVSPSTITSDYINSTGEHTLTIDVSNYSTMAVKLLDSGPSGDTDAEISSVSYTDNNPPAHTSYRVYAEDDTEQIKDFSLTLKDADGNTIASGDADPDAVDFTHELVEGNNYTFSVEYTNSDGNTVTSTSDEFTAQDQNDSIEVDGSTYEIYTEEDADGNEYVVYTVDTSSNSDSHGTESQATEKGSLDISVDDTSGNDIANASVTVMYDDGATYDTAETDENGTAVFSEVSTGNYTVKVNHADYDAKEQQTSVSDNQTTNVGFTLSESTTDSTEGSIHVRAEDGGDGIEGATIEVVDGNGQILATGQTDADGFAGLTGISEGNYTVEFTHDSYQFDAQDVEVVGGESAEVYFGDASEDSTQSTEEGTESTPEGDDGTTGGNVVPDSPSGIIVLVGSLITIVGAIALLVRD